MKLFRMCSEAIDNTRAFSTYFSPYELLLSRNEAAVFILNKYRLFTPETRFFAELFFLVTVTPAKASGAVPERLADIECMRYVLLGADRAFVKHRFSEEDYLRDARLIFDLTRSAPLSEADRCAAFCLLLAGYRLASRHPDETGFTITSEEIADAYNGISRTPVSNELTVTDSFCISVTPEASPTVIRIDREAADRALNNDNNCRISVKQLLLAPSKSPFAPTSAELHVINTEDGSRETLFLNAGDSIFVNLAGNIPVYVHPRISRGRACTAERLGTTVSYSDGTEAKKLTVPDIISAVAETDGRGFMMLRGIGLDSSHYSGRAGFIFDGEAAVEVYTCPEGVIWLCDDGTVFSDFKSFSCSRKYCSIEDFLKNTDEVK